MSKDGEKKKTITADLGWLKKKKQIFPALHNVSDLTSKLAST